MSREYMLTGEDLRRKPLSLMSKGEKNWEIEKLLPSMPKGENVEYGCH